MHATRRVKPTTGTITPFDVAPCSDEDAAWAARAFATDTFRLDDEYSPDEAGEPDWDALALESAMVDRICCGHIL